MKLTTVSKFPLQEAKQKTVSDMGKLTIHRWLSN